MTDSATELIEPQNSTMTNLPGNIVEKQYNGDVTQEVEINELVLTSTDIDQHVTNQVKVSHSDFDLLSVIGRGGYGKVFLVRKNNGIDANQLYAMKVLKKARLVLHKKDSQLVISERNIMESVRHPFLVRLCYAFQCDSRLYLCMEYLPGGDLFRRMDLENTFLEKEALFYVSEIVLALCHLHSLGIIYRDLKPENVVLDAEGHVKLTDFGMCKEALGTDGRTHTFCGTAEYMAPEIIEKKGYDKAVDWWSLGIMLYFMLDGKTPFLAKGEQKIYQKILKGQYFMPKYFTDACKGFIKLLLLRNPAKRLGSGAQGSENVKAHTVFRSVNWTATLARQVEPPYRPQLSSQVDVSQFDPEFTQMDPIFTPDDRQVMPVVEPVATKGRMKRQVAVPMETPQMIPSIVRKSRCRDYQVDAAGALANGTCAPSETADFMTDIFRGFSYVAPDVLEDLATTEWLATSSSSSFSARRSFSSDIPLKCNSLTATAVPPPVERKPFINADDFEDQDDPQTTTPENMKQGGDDVAALTALCSQFQPLSIPAASNADCEWSFDEILDHSTLSTGSSAVHYHHVNNNTHVPSPKSSASRHYDTLDTTPEMPRGNPPVVPPQHPTCPGVLNEVPGPLSEMPFVMLPQAHPVATPYYADYMPYYAAVAIMPYSLSTFSPFPYYPTNQHESATLLQSQQYSHLYEPHISLQEAGSHQMGTVETKSGMGQTAEDPSASVTASGHGRGGNSANSQLRAAVIL